MRFAESEVTQMEMVKRFEPLALFLMIVGALNWGDPRPVRHQRDHRGLRHRDASPTSSTCSFGVSALVLVPRLMEALHIGHGPTRAASDAPKRK